MNADLIGAVVAGIGGVSTLLGLGMLRALSIDAQTDDVEIRRGQPSDSNYGTPAFDDPARATRQCKAFLFGGSAAVIAGITLIAQPNHPRSAPPVYAAPIQIASNQPFPQ